MLATLNYYVEGLQLLFDDLWLFFEGYNYVGNFGLHFKGLQLLIIKAFL
jgi:hypothetical protein